MEAVGQSSQRLREKKTNPPSAWFGSIFETSFSRSSEQTDTDIYETADLLNIQNVDNNSIYRPSPLNNKSVLFLFLENSYTKIIF